MKTNIEIKQRENYAIIEVTNMDGHLLRIEVKDFEPLISITTIDGTLGIYPKTSNQILVKTLS